MEEVGLGQRRVVSMAGWNRRTRHLVIGRETLLDLFPDVSSGDRPTVDATGNSYHQDRATCEVTRDNDPWVSVSRRHVPS